MRGGPELALTPEQFVSQRLSSLIENQVSPRISSSPPSLGHVSLTSLCACGGRQCWLANKPRHSKSILCSATPKTARVGRWSLTRVERTPRDGSPKVRPRPTHCALLCAAGRSRKAPTSSGRPAAYGSETRLAARSRPAQKQAPRATHVSALLSSLPGEFSLVVRRHHRSPAFPRFIWLETLPWSGRHS
jgi:hypothetical protein